MKPASEAEGIKETQTIEAASVPPVFAKSEFGEYTVSLTEQRGQVRISWTNPNSFKLTKETVRLYAGAAGKGKHIFEKECDGPSGFYDTGEKWGTGWSVDLFAQDWKGDNHHIARTPVTGD